MNENEVDYTYETKKFKYQVKPQTYTVDFTIKTRTGKTLLVEAKGRFTSRDRIKHLLVKEQYPEYEIRFLFMRASEKLNRRSKTTYGDWATKNGFLWKEGTEIPKGWLEE